MDQTCSHQCGGGCCEVFYLNSPPEKRKEHVAHAHAILEGTVEGDEVWARETIQIDEMVIQLDDVRYTCKHYDWVQKLCSIYEQRPSMCRNYPYASHCECCGFVSGAGLWARHERRLHEALAIPLLPEVASV